MDSEGETEEEEDMMEQVDALLPLQDDSDTEIDSVVSEYMISLDKNENVPRVS